MFLLKIMPLHIQALLTPASRTEPMLARVIPPMANFGLVASAAIVLNPFSPNMLALHLVLLANTEPILM